ncbi:MAG: hypothetical protein FJ272_14050, partial [Planctomycetes bacterium]|nr:hypothetical protein [Planctomycetota bacterium]
MPSRNAAAMESRPTALSLAFLCAFGQAATALAGQDVVVGPETGATEAALQTAINAAIKAGGGRVLVKPGTYLLHRGLRLNNVKDVSLVGEPGARLMFAPEVHTVAAADAAQGETVIQVESAAGIDAGMTLEIQAPGHTYESPDGRKHVCPYFGATVASVSGNQITTTRGLRYAVPKGTKLLHLYNAILLSGRVSNVLIEGLEIDLNRDAWPVRPINHSEHCAVFAAGPYDYEKGPTGPPIERVTIRNCVLRNSHHRGVAFYSVVRSAVVGCRIENAGDEAIDFDHFCFHCEARDNDIRNAPVGVELNDPSDCVVENNRIDGCEKGINLWRWC